MTFFANSNSKNWFECVYLSTCQSCWKSRQGLIPSFNSLGLIFFSVQFEYIFTFCIEAYWTLHDSFLFIINYRIYNNMNVLWLNLFTQPVQTGQPRALREVNPVFFTGLRNNVPYESIKQKFTGFSIFKISQKFF